MATNSLDLEPACPGTDEHFPVPRSAARALRAERRAFDSIARDAWDELATRNPWATPFSQWAFQRAWWDAYGSNAHEETVVVFDPEGPDGELVGIVPLMHRHEVETRDALTRTTLRPGAGLALTPVEPTAKAVFFGASYHSDLLAADQPADAAHPMAWDVVDLRRLRCGDPAADALADAFGAREIGEGWTLNLEREDVCPVVTLPASATFDEYLATLGKKERHEVRRKLRRAEAAGEVRFDPSPDPLADLDAFIELHQKRWQERGLFPATEGGAQSRLFVRRLFELFGADGPVQLSFLTVGGRRIAAGIGIHDRDGYLYYNAGVDPDARDLSPGVVMIAKYIEQAMRHGCRRLDFLRGDEPYKYEWGAVDEPIQRLLVRRRTAA